MIKKNSVYNFAFTTSAAYFWIQRAKDPERVTCDNIRHVGCRAEICAIRTAIVSWLSTRGIRDGKKERLVYSHYRNSHAGYDETGGIIVRRGILRSIAGPYTPCGFPVVTARNERTILLPEKLALSTIKYFFKKTIFRY